MNKPLHISKYLISDILSASAVWTLFYIFRKQWVEPLKFGYDIPVEFGTRYQLGLVTIPIFWVLIYYLVGYYKDIYRKSRLKELGQTLFVSIVGVTIIFFVSILDDTVESYKNYYFSFSVLLSLHFVLTYLPRLWITTRTVHRIQNGKISFSTILIGSNTKALQLYEDFLSKPKSGGNKFVGFINVLDKKNYLLSKFLPRVGELKDLLNIIKEKQINEVIIAIESSEHDEIGRIINKLQETDVTIKVIPDMYDILTGKVRMSSLYGVPLIQITHSLMPVWEENLKRVSDVIIAIFALIILAPVFIFLIFGVKFSSKGPIIYSHERIGRYGKPFIIYKFRSMFIDAEKNGPSLSSKNDSRITKFGKFMRKFRLDEFPQFFNVLIGDMSLVGPRPERLFFIEQIINKAPHYAHLQKVRPGITSWGQVKFGYAENVEEMIIRLKYDIIYIENMSIYVDIKILIYTIRTILEARGK
ncbi:MAG: sugar transferase [Bacteroidetes bacterium]|jgi:exopolysaccharide biosynthesis polyprenyl glycosylphosphotransferase|nr:sugar transferase [Bacteroidota bacterium]MBT6688032.1 sugar transferase [Bacteroidota bacterium]MBT7144804.1 sugar transferase [Bacteroidota bacterium]MBT7492395.1 sugar transferase [Bacteroidota bacterium]